MLLGCRKPLFNSWVGKISWRSDKPLTLVFLGFPGGSAGKESTCNAQDLGSIPGLGRFPWKRERLPASVFWPGEFHGLCNPWSHKKADMTEQLSLRFTSRHICHSFSSKEQASFNLCGKDLRKLIKNNRSDSINNNDKQLSHKFREDGRS